MRKTKIAAARGCLLILLITFHIYCCTAQTKAGIAVNTFELKNGDRVVFLGNSLFENDMQYGYLELALTTRFPNRDVTFRNLGWSGDNVFGDARSYYSTPPTSYELLIEQITKAKPSLVFLGYGGIEAQEGEAGLSHFKAGLNNLLNKVDSLGARTVLLSPISVLSGDSAQNLAKRNEDIELYADAISKIAKDRGKRFIDIFNPIRELAKTQTLTENGIHLNETGYYYLTKEIEKALGLKSSVKTITATVSKNGSVISEQAKLITPGKEKITLAFTFKENYLPLPVPAGVSLSEHQMIIIKGLKKGFYTLSVNNDEVISASSKKWEEGVLITHGPSFTQVRQLREMILKKNELFFFQYRPLNRTYILGFRSYEQGRHVKGLEEQNLIIKWLEGQIALHRVSNARVYQLTELK